jgi:acyl dehydratase
VRRIVVARAQQQRILTWAELLIGQDAPPVSIVVTRDMIANYARSLQEDNPIFLDDETALAEGYSGIPAPASMYFVYAPARRLDIMHTRGFISPEEAAVNPRSTPFVGTEVHWHGVQVYLGDVITSVPKWANKWESRSGNKFVSIGVEATNQHGEKVVDYLYNIMWEFARGQKSRAAGAAHMPSQPEKPTGGLIDPATVSFDSVQVGDRLPSIRRDITQELINGYSSLNDWDGRGLGPTALLHVDEAFAEATVFAGTTLHGPAAAGHLVVLLQKAFQVKNIINSSFVERALEPVRPGDTVIYSGTVLHKREEAGKRILEVEAKGTNQLGQTTAAAKATVPL